ncbi:MAG: hypothetical protein EAX95_15495 [Candidatus Thorarchaeota archaeon]|nr:hypothetical protein [Candidatus Thorarchaeota archaeon]
MPLSGADETVIQRIREGALKAYPEQRYVDPALAPGAMMTLLFAVFLLLSIIGPGFGPMSFEISLLGTLIGVCVLIAGIAVWRHFRSNYAYLGMWRFQLALSITALELANHGHKQVKPIISPSYPEEYLYLPNFVAFGPGNLLKRLQGVDIDSKTLTMAASQADRVIASLFGTLGALTLLGGIFTLLAFAVISVISDSMNLFLLLLGLMLLFLSLASLLYAWLKARALERQELNVHGSRGLSRLADDAQRTTVDASGVTGPAYTDFSRMFDYTLTKVRVSDVLSFLRSQFPHPIRLLVLDTYKELEYTGRTYLTGNEIELREAILLPGTALY